MSDEVGVLARIAHGVLFQEVEGEAVLMDVDRGLYFTLDAIGTRMLVLAGREPDADGVVGVLLEEYDTDEATLRRDLDRLLGQLQASGLVELRAPGPGPAAGAP